MYHVVHKVVTSILHFEFQIREFKQGRRLPKSSVGAKGLGCVSRHVIHNLCQRVQLAYMLETISDLSHLQYCLKFGTTLLWCIKVMRRKEIWSWEPVLWTESTWLMRKVTVGLETLKCTVKRVDVGALGKNKKSRCSDDSHSSAELEKWCYLCILNKHQSICLKKKRKK